MPLDIKSKKHRVIIFTLNDHINVVLIKILVLHSKMTRASKNMKFITVYENVISSVIATVFKSALLSSETIRFPSFSGKNTSSVGDRGPCYMP